MMTQQLQLSVLSAPLAEIDRRSLSQAWYSVLYRARAGESAVKGRAVRGPSPAAARASAVKPERARFLHRAGPRTAREIVRRLPVESEGSAIPERRAQRSGLARKIEAAFLRPLRPVQRASFSIDGGTARVHVTLQTVSCGLALVAVCSPHARSTVARALQEARYALAARGITLVVAGEEMRK
jgi:hypothetical protein